MSHGRPPSIRDRIRLRATEPADLPVLFEHQCDPESCRMAVVNARSRESFDEIWEKIFREGSAIARVITLDGQVVGGISCFKMDGQDAVGYWIGREHWGKGIGSRALELFLAEVAIRPLHAKAASSNLASRRILERGGFVQTACAWEPGSERYPACEVVSFILR